MGRPVFVPMDSGTEVHGSHMLGLLQFDEHMVYQRRNASRSRADEHKNALFHNRTENHGASTPFRSYLVQILYFQKYSVVVPLESGIDIGVIGEVAEDVKLAGVSAGLLLHLHEAVGLEHFISSPLRKLVYYYADKKGSGGLYDITKKKYRFLCKKTTK